MLAHRRLVFGVIAGLALAFSTCSTCSSRRAPIEVATFNIRNFPESEWQSLGAFAAIAELEVSVVGVQEIGDPATFEIDAARQLGASWEVEFDANVGSRIRLGLLFDGERWGLVDKRSHAIGGRADQRPALEVRLRSRVDARDLRVFVVHLKAGGSADDIGLRAAQLGALTPIVREAMASEDEIVVLGDFNATSLRDRESLARFAAQTGASWASESLECTSYWRPDAECRGSALDHVFTRGPASSIVAAGPCEQFGCSPGDRCPAFYDWVSDHCPVRARL